MKRCTCLSHKRCTQASDEPPSSGYLCRGSGGYLPTSGSPSALPCPQPPLGIEPNTVNLKDWRPTTELSRLVVNTSAANTSVATPQWSAMRKQQICRNMMGQRGRIQLVTLGRVVLWYHTPTASWTKKEREREGGKRAEGRHARRPQTSGAWFRSTDLWVMSPTR